MRGSANKMKNIRARHEAGAQVLSNKVEVVTSADGLGDADSDDEVGDEAYIDKHADYETEGVDMSFAMSPSASAARSPSALSPQFQNHNQLSAANLNALGCGAGDHPERRPSAGYLSDNDLDHYDCARSPCFSETNASPRRRMMAGRARSRGASGVVRFSKNAVETHDFDVASVMSEAAHSVMGTQRDFENNDMLGGEEDGIPMGGRPSFRARVTGKVARFFGNDGKGGGDVKGERGFGLFSTSKSMAVPGPGGNKGRLGMNRFRRPRRTSYFFKKAGELGEGLKEAGEFL